MTRRRSSRGRRGLETTDRCAGCRLGERRAAGAKREEHRTFGDGRVPHGRPFVRKVAIDRDTIKRRLNRIDRSARYETEGAVVVFAEAVVMGQHPFQTEQERCQGKQARNWFG